MGHLFKDRTTRPISFVGMLPVMNECIDRMCEKNETVCWEGTTIVIKKPGTARRSTSDIISREPPVYTASQ